MLECLDAAQLIRVGSFPCLLVGCWGILERMTFPGIKIHMNGRKL